MLDVQSFRGRQTHQLLYTARLCPLPTHSHRCN